MEIEQNIFYDEVVNKLTQMENALIDAQDNPGDMEYINEVFRSVHTIKGVADLLGFIDIVKLIHTAEDVLDEIRSQKQEFDSKIFYLFIELKKFISNNVENILNGVDMDESTRRIFNSFEKELITHTAKTILFLEIDEQSIKKINDSSKYLDENVVCENNINSALTSLEKKNIKLAFIDIADPRIEGEELIRKIRESSEYKHLPIILLSDDLDEYLVNFGREFKAKGWLLKPFTKVQLLRLVDKLSI